MSKKEIKEVLRELQREGCTISRTGTNHWKIVLPDGKQFTCSSSPSCPHAHKNLLKDIQRYKEGRRA